ncbi:hypothetical protein PTKIN_Ptkin10aG0173500 [Pterospermum kingtungense]
MFNLLKHWFSKPFIGEIRIENGDGEEETVRVPWDRLPACIWGLILQRLPLVDRVHASVVCKEWNSILKESVQPIWMLLFSDLLNKDNDDALMYLDLSEGTLGTLNFPKALADEDKIFGASKGWLAFYNKTENNLPYLLDPLSLTKIPLPPIPTTIVKTPKIVGHIEISSKDASQSVVAATFHDGKTLALCRPKDKRWTVFEGLADKYSFADLLFCDGILYAFVDSDEFEEETSFEFQTHSMKLAGGDDRVNLKLLPSGDFQDIRPVIFLDDPIEGGDIIEINSVGVPYMVESNGELLIVVKILDGSIFEEYDSNEEIDDDLPPPKLSYFRVQTFEVFKVEASDTLRVTRLSNLNGRTLFIDGVNSLSLVAGENFSENCIYFLEDGFGHDAHGWKPDMMSRESGVFHLDNGRIERWFPSSDLTKNDRVWWFSPNIKIGDFH